MRYSLVSLLASSSLIGEAVSVVFHRRQSSLAAAFSNSSNAWSPQTSFSLPNTTEFFGATERWTLYSPPVYGAALAPATEEDVVQAVKIAKQSNISFLATGGRHGYSTTLAELQGGLAIDLSKMNTVTVDKDAAQLTIGPGVRFRDIFEPVYEAGFEIQTGTCSCVGFIGATLGGGIGRSHGIHGMIIDALVSARVVTANGEIVEASETSNPDLFWGLRGAGQNFGIVTSATYKLHPLRNNGIWTSADIIFTAEKNASYFETVEKMHPIPAELTVETIINYNFTLEAPQLMLSLVYAGPKDKAIEAIAPILALEPSYQLIKEIKWTEVSTQTTFLLDEPVCKDSQIYDVYPINWKTFNATSMSESFAKLAQFWEDNESGKTAVITVETWPTQATMAVPDDATAYPWRDTTTYIMIQMIWKELGDPVQGPADEFAVTLRSELAAVSGYGDLAVYQNYAWGDETLEQIYGARKLPKLAKLKAQYDPDNVFRFYHNLPTSYPEVGYNATTPY